MDMTHGNPWGVAWDPRVGTMGAPWVGSLSLLGLKGPLGLLGPWASWALGPLGPQGLMAPQGTQGSGFMVLCMSLTTRGPCSNSLNYAINYPPPCVCKTA